jgi:hypothetical protein
MSHQKSLALIFYSSFLFLLLQCLNVSYGAGNYLLKGSKGIVSDISLSGGARFDKNFALGLGIGAITKTFNDERTLFPVFAEMGLFKSNFPMFMLRGGIFLLPNNKRTNDGLYVAAKLGYNIVVDNVMSITPYVVVTHLKLSEHITSAQLFSGGLTFGSKVKFTAAFT